ncbi:hypothetical protein MTO96_025451 [Rhipicephalus appendiculatus]
MLQLQWQGHFGNVCEKKRNVNTVELHPGSSTKNTDVAKFVRVGLNGHDGLFKVGTGAALTVVSKGFPGVPEKLRKPDQVLTGPGNTRLDVLGLFQATLEWKEKGECTPSPSADLPPEPVDLTFQGESSDGTQSPSEDTEQGPSGTTSCKAPRNQDTSRTRYGRVVRKPERLNLYFQAR